MSEAFEILNTRSDKYPLIVVAKNYLGLSDYISELETRLRKNRFKGNVIFDFLLSNGFKSDNRFMCSSFNGKVFRELHKYSLDGRHKYLMECLNKYYFNNQDILSKGILSKNEILVIKTTHNIVFKTF